MTGIGSPANRPQKKEGLGASSVTQWFGSIDKVLVSIPSTTTKRRSAARARVAEAKGSTLIISH